MYSRLVYVPRQSFAAALFRWRNIWDKTAVCATAAQRNTENLGVQQFSPQAEKNVTAFFSTYAKRKNCASFFFWPVAGSARKLLSTPHVKLFNFDTPDRGRGGVSYPAPSPKRHTKFYITSNTGDGRALSPPVIYTIEQRKR